MVGASFQQFVLEGQFGEVAQLVVAVVLGIAADDVVGLLLALVDTEALEAFSALGEMFRPACRGVHAAQV